METFDENDQFRLLEERVDTLIKFITSLKQEKESLVEKIQLQEEKIAGLGEEVEHLKGVREKVKVRIVSLLEKIEQLDM